MSESDHHRRELISRICELDPDITPERAASLLARFEPDYAEQFLAEEIARHFKALSSLSLDNPAVVLFGEERGGLVACIVAAFDHPFEFSSITGLLAATGFSIEQSAAFTLPPVGAPRSARETLKRVRSTIRKREPMADAVILDHFRGRLTDPNRSVEDWAAQFEPLVVEVITLLDREDPESVERAKRIVNERVTQALKAKRTELSDGIGAGGLDVSIEQLPRATRLRLRAPDAPAFLYALSTALSLHDLLIATTSVETIDGHAIDEIDVVDSVGKPITDPDRLQRLNLSVLLTHRFAYFLDRAPDPFTALRRFEALSERIVQSPEHARWLKILGNPQSLEDLAKVLGASDYLWEDFIRVHTEVLLPALEQRLARQAICPPSRSLPRRLEQALHGSNDLEEMRNRLNQFKDRELFLIDLDHLVASENLDVTFQILSERLVTLAETIVAAAARWAFADLVRHYGKPVDERRSDVGYAVFGLGKLGGVALGYASDIELLFLYDIDGGTTGGADGALPNNEFFARLTRNTCDSIRSKGEGIFRVDLRLRPFGKGGPLASSRQQFAEYFDTNGPAHPFERLALVRLRWIAGDPQIGFAVEQLRDRLLYEGPPLDMNALWEISEQMRAQHLGGRQNNTKYSPGALADLESTVQLLQVMHGKDAPQLRTPRIHEALLALHRAGILSPVELDDLMGAYQFLRRVINAQRVLRGSAKDLFLPAKGSDELVHLARRMSNLAGDTDDEGTALLNDFQRHAQAVIQFIKRRFDRDLAR